MRGIKALVRRIRGGLKLVILKICHPRAVKTSFIGSFAGKVIFTVDNGGRMTIGKNLQVRRNIELSVTNGGCLKIGRNVFMNSGVIIAAHDKIAVGNSVSFGPGVKVFDHDHDFRAEGGKKSGKYKTRPIVIEDDVWLGADVIILKGVKIGKGAVVGAGTVVTHDIPEKTVLYQKPEQVLGQF